MRAVVLTEFGPAEHLAAADVPDPIAAPGEVLVAVHAASITFVETQIRAGRPPHPALAPDLPVVPGNGVGGVGSLLVQLAANAAAIEGARDDRQDAARRLTSTRPHARPGTRTS